MLSEVSSERRPYEPDLFTAQRARVILDFVEDGQHIHEAAHGWALLQGEWLLWLPDEKDHWQSWPLRHVFVVEWQMNARSEPDF